MRKIPDLNIFVRRLKACALMDLALSPDWEMRYYSFNSDWDPTLNQQMASMRSGSGAEYFFVITPEGCWGKIFDGQNHIDTSNLTIDFSVILDEPAFNAQDVSLLLNYNGGKWEIVPNEHDNIPLLDHLSDDGDTYTEWAENYFDVSIDKNLVRKIFSEPKLDEEMLKTINPSANFSEIETEINEIIV